MSKKENKIITSRYNKYTFFFVNMYHQLGKSSNLFFLLTMILLTIPQISPFNPYTYLLAFCIVTGTSMIKDGIEDYKRHKQDEILNKKLVTVLTRDNDLISPAEIFVEDLQIGDFILVKENENVPGDAVLLMAKSKDKKGLKCKKFCFVDSSNLDGESNLKKKNIFFNSFSKTCIFSSEYSTLSSLNLCSCDINFIRSIESAEVKDTGDIFTKFECIINMNGRPYICNEKNVLLKGMNLRNVDSALMYVVSVGKNTKLGRSNVNCRKNTSLFEKEVTKVVKIVFGIYFVLLLSSSIMSALFLTKSNIIYLYLNEYKASEALKSTGTNYILFSYLIPLSLFVTLEVSRIIHALYVNHDISMKNNDVNAICRNSSVTEDLGMIEYILTDKTGTLTKNKMVFRKIHEQLNNQICEIVNVKLNLKNLQDLQKILEKQNSESKQILFILALLCCNSVEPLYNKYEGISQDEICIIKGLSGNNMCLIQRESNFVKVKINQIELKIEILCTLDFSSSRQRMTVIVKIFDKYYVMCKGSDQVLLDKKRINDKNISEKDLKILIDKNSFYRILLVCYKEILKEEVDLIILKLQNVSLTSKSKDEEHIFSNIETELNYLGTTFVEDELQDEVVETIESLKKANIKIWMITGDKKETAISCAVNCGIMSSLHDNTVKAIEGDNFENEIQDENIFSFKSVILYRSTPKQKGKIAAFFKNLQKNTLAIGDGNNDVPMIMTADVGVGILGKEGNQAGLSADFAIPNFRSLKYLILVHGRYNFIRFSKVTLNAFYKNIYLIMIQYFYNFYTGFSGKSVYNTYFLNYYNIFFTSLIPASICCFDKDKPESDILEHPEDYKLVKAQFCKRIVIFELVCGLVQGIVTFLLVLGILYKKDLISHNGKVGGYNAMNNLVSLLVFSTVLCGQIRKISFFNIMSYIAIFLSLIICFITLFLVQDISLGGDIWVLLGAPVFYFMFLFLFIASIIMDTLLKYCFDKVLKKENPALS